MVAALEAVQAALVAHDGRLKRACVAACTAHITLGVMHLGAGALALCFRQSCRLRGMRRCRVFRQGALHVATELPLFSRHDR